MNPQTPMANDPSYGGYPQGTMAGYENGQVMTRPLPPGSLVPMNTMPGTRMIPQNIPPTYPMGGAPAPSGPNPAAVDVIGPVMRRKFLVAFLGLIGAGIGYMSYVNAPIVYESTARLMITTHSPPSIINGETVVQRVVIPKHEKLLSSQLVLSNAVVNGKFAQLPMFRETNEEMLVGKLQKDVLAVIPSKNTSDETLVLSAKGPIREDLPKVLRSIVQSYREEISKDSQMSGRESVALIEKMHRELDKEKSEAQREYVAILTKLNLPNVEQGDRLVNPYTEDVDRIAKIRNQALGEQTEVVNRLQTVDSVLASPDETQITYLVNEAKRFLGGGVETLETMEERRAFNHEFSRQIFVLERELNELRMQRDAASKTYGSRHPRINDLNQRIYYTQQQLSSAQVQQREIDDKNLANERTTESLEEKLDKRNRKWIAVYKTALATESQRLADKLLQLDADLFQAEEQARVLAGDFLQLNVLKSRISENQKKIDELLARLSQLNIVSQNFTETRVRVIDEPGDGRRVAPVLLQHLGIGLAIGGLLGIGLAVLIDRSDMTYRNPGEIFERLKVPVISRIPGVRISKKLSGGAGNPALTTLYKPTSKMAEAVRAARTSILFTAQNTGSKVFLFTSPSPGDGKSTTTANLAISLAQAGKRVVLVDADFRRPRVQAYFEQPMEPGIMQVTAGTVSLDDALHQSEQEFLSLLTAGGRPKNPGEVVISTSFGEMLGQLREKFDIVLIDSPPLLPVADAAVISSLVDGVYMVIRIRKGVVVTSSKAKEKLDMVNANLLGVIVNGVDDNPHYNEYGSYGYGYGYGYGGSSYGNGSYYESRNSRYQEKIGTRE